MIKEGVYADLISYGAYASRVNYFYGGILYDVFLENDEIEFLEDGEEYE